MGTLGDLLVQLNIDGKTPYSDFVAKMSRDSSSPAGIQIPSTDLRIGGAVPPGTPKPQIEFEMVQPETVGADGRPRFFGLRVPVAHGAVPETMPMADVVKMLHNPQITVVSGSA